MPRSSESMAALAGALAKAQVELTNPEKSLVATLPAERGHPGRSFRYASLAGGLEIVRKTLGQHEIATLQTTAIDLESGTIKLTTTLAHTSGEWIASDWPVCALAELPTPHRMGAALTYARRYGLFTLVGIAGEDDLDAPDFPLQAAPPAPLPVAQTTSPPLSPASRGRNGRSQLPQPVTILDPDASGRQRDELLAELGSISSFDGAAEWAKRIIPIKNTLTAEHAHEVEAGLEIMLAQVRDGASEVSQVSERRTDAVSSPPTTNPASSVASPARRPSAGLNFEDYPVTPKTRRRRDKRHREFVAAQACVICGRQPSDAHHLRFAQPRGLGLKVSDEFTVPLCRSHHRELHRTRNESRWWAQFGIQPKSIAYKLWTQTHPVPMPEIRPAMPVDASASGAQPNDQPVAAARATTSTAN